MTGQQEVVPWLDSPGEAHEQRAVDDQSWVVLTHSHVAGDLLRRLVHVHHRCDHEAPVECGTPEVSGLRTYRTVDEGAHRVHFLL